MRIHILKFSDKGRSTANWVCIYSPCGAFTLWTSHIMQWKMFP